MFEYDSLYKHKEMERFILLTVNMSSSRWMSQRQGYKSQPEQLPTAETPSWNMKNHQDAFYALAALLQGVVGNDKPHI